MFIHIFFSIFGKFWLHESALLAAMKKFWLQYGSIKFIIHCAFTASTIELLSSLCTKFQIIKWLLQKLKEQCKQWTCGGVEEGEYAGKVWLSPRTQPDWREGVTTVWPQSWDPAIPTALWAFGFIFCFFLLLLCFLFFDSLSWFWWFFFTYLWFEKMSKKDLKKIFIFPKQSLLTLF